jgi:hypothetical protein
MAAVRFAMKFDAGYERVSRALLISPADSYVEIEGNDVSMRMAWAFRAAFQRSDVARAFCTSQRVGITRGVHGWAGRWLVNGASDGIVAIDLDPRQRARVMGFPVALRQLQVSVDDPRALAAALGPNPSLSELVMRRVRAS